MSYTLGIANPFDPSIHDPLNTDAPCTLHTSQWNSDTIIPWWTWFHIMRFTVTTFKADVILTVISDLSISVTYHHDGYQFSKISSLVVSSIERVCTLKVLYPTLNPKRTMCKWTSSHLNVLICSSQQLQDCCDIARIILQAHFSLGIAKFITLSNWLLTLDITSLCFFYESMELLLWRTPLLLNHYIISTMNVK